MNSGAIGPTSAFDLLNNQNTKPPPTMLGDPNSFSNAANKQGNDYDTIMSNYSKMFNTSPISPISYSGSPDVNSAMGNLKDLSTTGGYSDKNIADIRARGISPIRSIYANAKANLDRQKVLQGGYSPGYGAATAKMAREQSDLISGRTTDVNAGIAQSVAQNRLAASSPYASLAENESGRGLDVSKFNAGLQGEDLARKMQATEGMRGLYGTTPSLTSTFGNQVVSAAQLKQNQQEINNRRSANNLSAGMRLFS